MGGGFFAQGLDLFLKMTQDLSENDLKLSYDGHMLGLLS